MSSRASISFLLPLLALVAVTWTAPSTAAGAGSFNRGEVVGVAVKGDPFTEVSFQNLHAEFDECGTLPNEESCTWSVEVVAHHASPCNGEESTVLWSSGPLTGNGSIDSGPQAIELGDCPGSGLAFTQWFKKTYGPWVGPGDPPPFYQTGFGRTVGLLTESLREAEERIIRESPAAQIPPFPEPKRLVVSPGCRVATVGGTRYAFEFKRLGCWKASRIATIAQGGGNPSGFRCKRRADGGFKCTRLGQPKKYVRLDVV